METKQSPSDKLKMLKSHMKNPNQQVRSTPTNFPQSQPQAPQEQVEQELSQEEFQEPQQAPQEVLSQEQMQIIQQELNQVATLQDNGIYRLEMLKNNLKSQDILIDFGKVLFDKLDNINSNLSRIAEVIEGVGNSNEEQTPNEN